MQATSPPSFVARRAEIEALRQLLTESRLVTVWGTAGIGKSRLVHEVARGWDRRAYAVPLGDVTTAEGISAAIARALGDAPMSARTGADLARQIGRRLRRLGPLLLVLDGFDHLVERAGEVLTPVLEETSECAILVTSRERLQLAEEGALELGPLSAEDAARLFSERARFAGNAAPWIERLEGIPLAIELAAASFDESEEPRSRLPERLARATSRHATMRAAIAWSWDRLSDRERRTLTGCAVFRGSFSLASAEQVLDVEPAHERAASIHALREKSLLVLRDEGGPGARYALFDVVREIVLEELARDEGRRAALVARHDAWFTRRGAELAARVERTGDIHARDTLARELDSLLEVHERAVRAADVDPEARDRALEALLAADAALATRASAHERLALLQRLCDVLRRAGAPRGSLAEDARCARALGRLGQALASVGSLDAAARTIEEGIRLLSPTEDDSRAELHLDLGVVHHARRDFEAARAAYVTALGDARSPRERRTLARVAGNLGALHHDEGKMEAARRSYERSVELASAVGDARIEGIMWANLAVLDQEEGRRGEALARYERALALLGQAKDQRLLAITRSNRGLVHLEERALEAALADHEAALAMLRPIAEVHSESLAMVRLGVTLSLCGRVDDAARLIGEATAAFERAGDSVGLEAARVAVAFLDLGRGDGPAASARLESVSDPRTDDAKTLLRILRAALEPAGASDGLIPAEALAVAPDASAFRPPGGSWVSLAANEAARRAFDAIVRHNEADPHGGLDAARLIAAAFPGEPLDPKVGRSRLYATISWLRSRGLEAILQRRPEGYCLDPAVRLMRAAPPEPRANGATSGLADRAKTGRRR